MQALLLSAATANVPRWCKRPIKHALGQLLCVLLFWCVVCTNQQGEKLLEVAGWGRGLCHQRTLQLAVRVVDLEQDGNLATRGWRGWRLGVVVTEAPVARSDAVQNGGIKAQEWRVGIRAGGRAKLLRPWWAVQVEARKHDGRDGPAVAKPERPRGRTGVAAHVNAQPGDTRGRETRADLEEGGRTGR